MSEVTIVFKVDVCRDDCPFCSYYKPTKEYFCSQLMGSPVNSPYTVIPDRNSPPLKFCPFRK